MNMKTMATVPIKTNKIVLVRVAANQLPKIPIERMTSKYRKKKN